MRWYRLVGPDEFDMAPTTSAWIRRWGAASWASGSDDEISVALPGGSGHLIIVDVKYGPKVPEALIPRPVDLRVGRRGGLRPRERS
jgi:hypothetical protein